MAAHEKPEVYLEVGCGFLRIPTEAVNYNITLLASPDSRTPGRGFAPPAPEKSESAGPRPAPSESLPAPAPPPPPAAAPMAANPEPSFHNLVCHQTHSDLNRLAEEIELSLVAANPEPQGVDPELAARLRGAGRQVENLVGALDDMGRQAEQAAGALAHEGAGAAQAAAPEVFELRSQLTAALELVAAMAAGAVPAPKAQPLSKPKEIRYAFDLDTVFQTIYELCTNETVKSHISGARAKAAAIFTKEKFWSAISPKVPSYPVDDGFVNVPMADMFPALAAACSEKAIVNLFTKMEAGKSSIFLDQSLPLALPAPEEIDGGGAGAPELAGAAEPDPRLGDLQALLAATLGTVEELSAAGAEASPGEESSAGKAAWEESAAQVALAKVMAQELEAELEAIASLLPQVAGAGGGGELALLAESRVKLQALAITLGSQLRQYEAEPGVTFIESLTQAQEEAEAYLARASQRDDPLGSPLSAGKETDELEQLEGFAELAELDGPAQESGMGQELDLDQLGAANAELDLEPLPALDEDDGFASSGVQEILGELEELDALALEEEVAPPPAAKDGEELAEQNDIDKLLAEMGMNG